MSFTRRTRRDVALVQDGPVSAPHGTQTGGSLESDPVEAVLHCPMKPTLSAVRDEPGRTAMCISLILHGDKAESRLPSVLYQLRQLEDEAQVVSTTDERGVVRWNAAPAEGATHGRDLGGQVFDTGEFRLSPDQLEALGL